MRRALAGVAVAVLVLTGCAGNDEPGAAEDPTSAPSPTTTPTGSASPTRSATPAPSPSPAQEDDDGAVEIEIEGERIEPNGERVQVSVGEPIVLEIESDRAAELHVHSSPEQVLEVERGESRIELTIDTPGVVDVEEHDSGIVVLRLEVR